MLPVQFVQYDLMMNEAELLRVFYHIELSKHQWLMWWWKADKHWFFWKKFWFFSIRTVLYIYPDKQNDCQSGFRLRQAKKTNGAALYILLLEIKTENQILALGHACPIVMNPGVLISLFTHDKHIQIWIEIFFVCSLLIWPNKNKPRNVV